MNDHIRLSIETQPQPNATLHGGDIAMNTTICTRLDRRSEPCQMAKGHNGECRGLANCCACKGAGLDDYEETCRECSGTGVGLWHGTGEDS